MSKKIIVTPRKSPRLVEGTFTDEVHAPTFNILTQTPSSKYVETPAKGGSSHSKDQKEKKTKQRKGDCGLYTCLFAEYISNNVFYMCSVDIDEKYHRQSESEVTGTAASKFGRPRIPKEHAPNTSNYPTLRSRKRNLR
ncbi:hypothetical protein H5410_032966 [Solanum commersonii]|uniref:Ulp1 protease family, C-terminal catalytic domain containing protein n=1 Tax=Solanum commersonii TaxID=4109 RepID=A0A9J5YR65_SOLCO|nr:hypothetical protein H5410_032966 [Solanum commersonii]